MKAVERERPDWIVVTTLVVIGFVCVIAAGQLALRFSSSWQLAANMESRLDPNSAFLTRRPSGFIEPIDSAILTQPGWIDVFLTPSAVFVTGTPFPAWTSTSAPTRQQMTSATNTIMPANSPTNTFVFVPPTRMATSRPTKPARPTVSEVPPTPVPPTDTQVFIITQTATPTVPAAWTSTSTTTVTPTFTATMATAIATDPVPSTIGTTPDGRVYLLSAGTSLTMAKNLVTNGDPGYDLVYYERPSPTGDGIYLDWVIVEIGDGNNWYTVFNWGDNLADANSNMDFNILPNPQTPPESDQRAIPGSALYNGTGIAIDVDAVVPPGTYSYVRFIAPTGDADGQMEIDAVEILP